MQIPHSGARYIRYISLKRENIFSFDSSLLEKIFCQNFITPKMMLSKPEPEQRGEG
jgi:hypothetical protein